MTENSDKQKIQIKALFSIQHLEYDVSKCVLVPKNFALYFNFGKFGEVQSLSSSEASIYNNDQN